MLNLLRADIIKENNNKAFGDLLMESIDTMEIRDAFIADEIEENDPELKKLIDEIPESDDDEDVSEEELAQLTESLIPEFNEVI